MNEKPNIRFASRYTPSQEIANAATHYLGVPMGIVFAVLCLKKTLPSGNAAGIVGSFVYALSTMVLYAISGTYHALRLGRAKRIMQTVDHCTIFLLIAGTYTPILLSAIFPNSPTAAIVLLAAEWGLAAIGAAITAIDHRKYAKFSMVCYLLMGWLIVFALPTALRSVGAIGFAWLLAGGVSFTVGAVLYVRGKKKPSVHTVFHVFTLIGSLLQAVCIVEYVL